MAEQSDSDGRAADAAQCLPCSGSGKVISNLGGEQSVVACPWCEGTGTRIAEHDAQAAWRARREAGDAQGVQAGAQG